MVNTFYNILVLDEYFIPDNKGCLVKELMPDIIFFAIATASLMNGDWDFKVGVGCAPSREQKRCDSYVV